MPDKNGKQVIGADGSKSAVDGLVGGLKRGLKRLWRYLFVRRLAVTPYAPLNLLPGETTDKMLYEWQKMPPGYRWF